MISDKAGTRPQVRRTGGHTLVPDKPSQPESAAVPPPSPRLQRFLLSALLLTAARQTTPETWWLQTIPSDYLRVWWITNLPGHDVIGSSASHFSEGCNQGVSSGTVVSREGSTERGPTCKLAHMSSGRTQVLVGHWTEGLRSSVAVGQTLPSAPCQRPSPLEQECKKSQRERMNASEVEVTVLA